MPIYQYECSQCRISFDELQPLDSDAKSDCPSCGKRCKRVVSQVSVSIRKDVSPDKASEKGFTTYKKAGEGTWEKVAGQGRDMIIGSKEDIASVKREKKRKVYDVDK